MTIEPGPSLAELARRIQDFYTRLEAIALRMETTFITKEFFDLSNKLQSQKFKNLETYADGLRTQSEDEIKTLQGRIEKLENNNTWLVRLVLGAVILTGIGVLIGSRVIKQ